MTIHELSGAEEQPIMELPKTAQPVFQQLAVVLAGQAASDAISRLEAANDNDDPGPFDADCRIANSCS